MTFATIPDAPTSLASAGTTPSQLSFEWLAPANNGFGPIDYYEITATLQTSPLDAITQTSVSTDFTFTGLRSSTTYVAKVRAHNVAGFGANSTTFNLATEAATVADAPTFAYSNKTARTLTLAWEAPVETGGVPIIEYLVIITDGDHSYNASVSATSHTFTGLDPSATYSFTIVAINSEGNGPVLAGSASTMSKTKLCKIQEQTITIAATTTTTNL